MAKLTEKQEHERVIAEKKEIVEELKNLISATEKRLQDKDLTEYDKCLLIVKLRSGKAYHQAQSDILQDRENYFKNEYMPQFENESAKCNEGFDKVLSEAKELLKDRTMPMLMSAGIKTLIEKYPKDNKDQDIKNALYKSLKFQIEAYKKMKKKKKIR